LDGQIFVLDRRIHGSTSIYHPHLAETQGPALLAYNNELIHDEDWEALQNIHRSSKKADTS
jgi:sacsin